MRSINLAVSFSVALGLMGLPALSREGEGRRTPTRAEVVHAKRMVRALDDYDAQLARRMRQLKAEQRRLERAGR